MTETGMQQAQVGGVTLGTIKQWFGYRVPNGQQAVKLGLLGEGGEELATLILNNTPPGPDQTAAIRQVREAVMTAGAAILYGA